MTSDRLHRTALSISLVLAPVTGLVAAVAQPALRATRSAEIPAIAAHPDRFYVYALAMLVSSLLLVPAFFGVLALLRERAPRWTFVAGAVAQTGLLIAIGDAAGELLYWQMGAPGADRGQMVALADRYENAAGSSVIYSIGGLAVVVGSLLIAVGLWRARALPRWAAVALAAGAVVQMVGFAAASQPLLIASFVLLLAAFVPVAGALLTRPAAADTAADRAHAPAASL
jgi:hypothetical protein